MMIDILSEAWISMKATLLRTFLTMLGIIIGVASVVLMLAIGMGAESDVKKIISSIGSNVVVVSSGKLVAGAVRLATGSAQTLTVDDAKAISEFSEVDVLAPAIQKAAQIVYGSNNWNTIVIGTTPEMLPVREWKMELGTGFTEQDVRSASRVVLIGKTVRDNLFGDEDPIGKIIRITNVPFEVIGVLESKGQTFSGSDQDDVIIIPLTTAQRKVFGTQFPGSVRGILIKGRDQASLASMQEKIRQLLRTKHKLKSGMDDDFDLHDLTAIAESASTTAHIMSLLLGAVASISLVVGGIGIMNIMLVSVTERTREIGIRKAIGAKQSSIMLQFFAEALIISTIGSFVGLAIGIGGAFLVKWIFHVSVQISIWSIVSSLAVAASIGVFFGYYPAQKAAKLKPIESLRYQ
jgi:putative ABC transport system permease protein